MASAQITKIEYSAFQRAYDFLNAELFGGSLPAVLVTLQRSANSRGYFAAERFAGRGDAAAVHEVALNPDNFTGRTDREILSTLAHEMVHVWQQTHGTPPRRGYHDREWAAKMREIGLQPSSTGEPGGQETGQRMTHFVVEGCAYAQAFAQLKGSGFALHWESTAPEASQPAKKASRASKTKYTCPECGQNCWARPGALVICGECYEDGEGDALVMLAEGEG